MRHLSILFIMLFVVLGSTSYAQKHKIVFQFTNAHDTLQQKAFTRQLQNLQTHWPKAKIEVVVYNNGIDYMLSSKSKHKEEIKALKANGVQFIVCQNTMNQRNITKDQLLSEAEIVPAGIAEIVEKQEKGWSYIKGGF